MGTSLSMGMTRRRHSISTSVDLSNPVDVLPWIGTREYFREGGVVPATPESYSYVNLE
jgi:hypothetical protein